MRRISDDAFYGPGQEAGGSWKKTEGPKVEPRGFYVAASTSPPAHLPSAATRIAAKPYTFAGVLLLVGFVAVFVNQAPLLFQIVAGAPIFEELFKFGLALLVAYPLRFLALRLPVAWVIGGSFGVLEHYVTYSAEDTAMFVGRILFHGGATGLSMALFHVLERVPEVRVRFWSPVWAVFIHYLNNSYAVVSLPLNFVDRYGTAFNLSVHAMLVAATFVTTAVVLAGPGRQRAVMERWTNRVLARAAPH
ncbi:MAG: hypothetical protein ACPGQL_09405 [Thermoplasmatota archaeon]